MIRPRGGASYPCPVCGGITEVLDTRREEGTVQRQRRCLQCGAKFPTREEEVAHGPSGV